MEVARTQLRPCAARQRRAGLPGCGSAFTDHLRCCSSPACTLANARSYSSTWQRHCSTRGSTPGSRWSDPTRGKAAALRRRSEDDPRISWEGALAPAEIPQRMAAASIYVLPSVREPYPMSVLEAMSVGLPVVVSRRLWACPAGGTGALRHRRRWRDCHAFAPPSNPSWRTRPLARAMGRARSGDSAQRIRHARHRRTSDRRVQRSSEVGVEPGGVGYAANNSRGGCRHRGDRRLRHGVGRSL